MYYASSIFAESGSDLDARISSIITGAIQLLAAICSSTLIDKIGRRILIIGATLCCITGLTAMGIFNYLAHLDYDLQSVNWIPVASISLSLFGASAGIIPLMLVVFAEVIPSKVRTLNFSLENLFSFLKTSLFQIRPIASIIYIAFLQLALCLVVTLFPIANELFGMYACVWFFAGCCVLGFFYIVFFLEDTTGKRLQ